MIINGKEIAAKVLAELKSRPRPLKSLVAVLVGDDAASLSFLKQKEKIAKELEVPFTLERIAEETNEEDLKERIEEICSDKGVGGVIVQLPLPEKFNRSEVLSAIAPEKDVDGLVGAALPPAALTVKEILNNLSFDLEGKTVGVVGKGFLVGAPIAKWLAGKCGEVIVFDSKSDLSGLKKADLVITGTGRAGLIKPEMLKVGAGVIDFGFGMVDGKIRGDLDTFNFELLTLNLSFYTPTPGGTGPILVAELFRNFYDLNK
ncbi:MAG: bifunctional 5,10-methylenetetrahydrofolate dehydrogenase/5,10-methenyltetrahydrofolate cyclohydrolase [bacterium]|nr:bifunctional 5,10-methylenetetrahydrofolate dehydrogenase/5,10-methenyltetrahydrofolate cyclohydrolase [bacterium]